MTIQEAKAVYDRHHIDKDNISDKDFATERDAARYELITAGLPPEDICEFEFHYFRKPRNLSDVVQSVRRHRERLQGGEDE